MFGKVNIFKSQFMDNMNFVADSTSKNGHIVFIMMNVLIRQGPRFSIRMVIGIFCSDTETGAVTPPGVMQKK